MKRLVGALAALFASVVMVSPASAANIALFFDSAYTDTTAAASGEAYNLQQLLISQGHTVTTFTGTTSATWLPAIAGQDMVVIPELSNNLAGALDGASIAALQAFVSGGKKVEVAGTSNAFAPSFMNTVFGYSTAFSASIGSGTTANLNGPGSAGTIFASGPATITRNNGTYALSLASIPAGAGCAYQETTNCWVMQASYGSGRVFYLGWDFFDAQPIGSQDNNWLALQVLINNAAVVVPATVPTMSEWAMILLALMLAGAAAHHLNRRRLEA